MSRKRVEAEAQNESMEYVAYYRVSTKQQKKSGLGLEAQQDAITKFIARHHQRTLAKESFQDIESGTHDDRPELAKAIKLCNQRGAKLLVAKLDRLARSQQLILDLGKAGVAFVVAEHPEMTDEHVGLFAWIAENEAKRIRERIREALAAKKRRGEKLGKSGRALRRIQAKGLKNSAEARRRRSQERKQKLATTVDALRGKGKTWAAIGAELEKLGHLPPHGGRWYPASVRSILA